MNDQFLSDPYFTLSESAEKIQSLTKTISDHFESNQKILSSSICKSIVVVVGSTGSGKSTLINFLCGIPLQRALNKEIKLCNENDEKAMKIGNTLNSQTLTPQFIEFQNFIFYDMPGFGDTRGDEINLVNAGLIKHIIENAASVRFIFTIGSDEITACRGASFKKMMELMKGLVNDSDFIENCSILVITKNSSKNYQEMIDFLNTKMGASEDKLLSAWINANKILPMSPKIDCTQKAQILQALSKTSCFRIEKVNIEAVFELNLKKLLRDLFWAEIKSIGNKCLNEFCIENSKSIEKIEEKLEFFNENLEEIIVNQINYSLLIKFLRPLAENSYLEVFNYFKVKFDLIKTENIRKLEKELEDMNKTEQSKEISTKISEINKKLRKNEQQAKEIFDQCHQISVQMTQLNATVLFLDSKLSKVQDFLINSPHLPFIPEPNAKYIIKNLYSNNIICGANLSNTKGSGFMTYNSDTRLNSTLWWFIPTNRPGVYKIKNVEFGKVLNSWGNHQEKNSVSIELDDENPNYFDHRYWLIVPSGICGYYKIKNVHSNNILDSWGLETGYGTLAMMPDIDHSHRFWRFIKV